MNNKISKVERMIRIVMVLVVVLPILLGMVGWINSFSHFPSSLLEQILIYALPAAGMSLLLCDDEVDFSIGGIAALAMVVTAVWLKSGVSGSMAVPGALALGLFIGLVNGIMTSGLRVPSSIITLLMLSLTSGLALFLTGNQVVPVPGQPFAAALGILIVSNLVVYLLGIGGLFFIARATSLSRLHGLNARSQTVAPPTARALVFYRLGAYSISGILAAGMGVALLNMLRTTTPTVAVNWTTMVLAAVVIGGATLWKGATRLIGAFLGIATVLVVQMGILILSTSLNPMLVLLLLALGATTLYGLVAWVLDLVFGKRAPEPAGSAPAAKPLDNQNPSVQHPVDSMGTS